MVNSGNASSNEDENSKAQPGNGWISKRDRHMQLINTNVYDKETQARTKAMAETRAQKARHKDRREMQKIQKFLVAVQSAEARAPQAVHELAVEGLRFRVTNDGSKLVRVRGEWIHVANVLRSGLMDAGESDSAAATPKQASIGGVTFLRSKNGNLYRSGIVKAKK